MTSFEIYVFFLCFIVFAAFTTIFTVMIVSLIRFYLKLVKIGAEDDKLKIEYEKARNYKKGCANKIADIIGVVITLALATVFLIGFITSTVISMREDNRVGSVPVLKVVMSSSMSYKEKNNKYLFDNDLNDQIGVFDLVVMRELPAEDELKLYDIVSYERDGDLILHRIVGIEEPNEKHPDQRYFLLQGDAVHVHDKFPVLYEDMKGIYRGENVPFLGSFFAFMRSPAGILCIILIVFACVATPIAERKIKQVKDERYAIICPDSLNSNEK